MKDPKQNKQEIKRILTGLLLIVLVIAGFVAFAGLLAEDLRLLRRGIGGIAATLLLLIAVRSLIKTEG